MNDQELRDRADRLMKDELVHGSYGPWWLSFADPSKPDGHGFLGAAIVRAPGFLSAVTFARMLGINPGGEVQGTDLQGVEIDAAHCNRLLSREEAEAVEPLEKA